MIVDLLMGFERGMLVGILVEICVIKLIQFWMDLGYCLSGNLIKSCNFVLICLFIH